MTDFLSGQIVIESPDITDEALAEISAILEDRHNFSISIYKDKCMRRRVAIRMRACRCHDTATYCAMLRTCEHELDILKKTLTIHVSHFFRNPSMFNQLQTAIFPFLFADPDAAPEQFRLLSLGCASGEEAYSLAIVVREFFTRHHLRTPVHIAAYDIDAEILVAAGKAEYTEDRLKDLPDVFKERYFVRNGNRMQLLVKIRDMVTFHQQNITDITSLGPCQLVLCRNTLIYFNRAGQEKILCDIAHILATGGILVLGKSETLVGEARKHFVPLCPIERIYRRV